MSTTDNIHRKVLSNNPLKTNFISNTNPKIKSQNEKRFSNISKQKQTIQKNPTRYYEQQDMQGSATILPQKSSSRQNIYANQNTNQVFQVACQQNSKKQYITSQQNLNIKGKSPIQKNRLVIQQLNIKNPVNVKKGTLTQIGNYSTKTSEIKTQRQKSTKTYRLNNKDEEKEQLNKMKSMLHLNKSSLIPSEVDQDLMCNEEMDIPNLMSKKQHSRNFSTVNGKKQNKIGIDQNKSTFVQNHIQNLNRTQKKITLDKGQYGIQKTRSQHSIKQPFMQINTQQASNPSQFPVNAPPHNYFAPTTYLTRQSSVKSHTSTATTLIHNNNLSHFHPKQNNFIQQEQLKKFLSIQNDINNHNQIETIVKLQIRQKQYLVQPNYIETKQKHFNWFMRAVLMDWMMHVCYEFGLKRETFYIALSVADKYLQKTNDLPKSQFQLVGAAAMFIAAKLQEFQALSSGDFSKSTDNRYSANDIKQMQIKICRTLNYQLNPPTLYMWANRFMKHWDNYLQLTNAKYHPYFESHKPKYFKKQFEESYLLFRQMIQFVDCSILDVQTLQFPPKILVCSFMYLVLGKNYKEWSAKRIVEQFPRSSHYLVNQEQEASCFNNLFHMFLVDSFDIDIIELLPAVQYCSTYFTLQLNFDPPSFALKNQEEQQPQMILEEYESFQTYNGKMIDLVKKRFRGVYL